MKNKRRERIGRVYEQFLELPVPVVLVILWLAGVALIGFIAAALYLYGAMLWRVAGA
jgi:hypothetical protein